MPLFGAKNTAQTALSKVEWLSIEFQLTRFFFIFVAVDLEFVEFELELLEPAPPLADDMERVETVVLEPSPSFCLERTVDLMLEAIIEIFFFFGRPALAYPKNPRISPVLRNSCSASRVRWMRFALN